MFLRAGYFLLLCCELLCVSTSAQDAGTAPVASTQAAPAKSEVDTLVDQLVENAVMLRAALPSITAHERVKAHVTRGILWENTTSEGSVRVWRSTDGKGLRETHQITSLNGKPTNSEEPKVPGLFREGFLGMQEMFFSPTFRPCYAFTFAPRPSTDGSIELRIALSPKYVSMSQCLSGLEELTGIARVDSATHHLVHLEYRSPTQADFRPSFNSADYAQIKIGGKALWLPVTTATLCVFDDGKTHMRTTMNYSNYHLFTASSKILPGTPVGDATQAPEQ